MTALARKSLLVFVGDVANALVGFVSTYFIAHRLGAEVLGTLGYFLGLLGSVAFITDLGLHQAFVKRASERPEEAGSYVVAFLELKAALASVLIAAFVVLPLIDARLAIHLSSPDVRMAYALIALFYLGNTVVAIPVFTLAARRETARMTMVGVCGNVLSGAAKIGVALSGWGLAALAAAYALQAVVAVVLGGALMRHIRLRRPARTHFVRLLTYAAPVSIVTVTAYIWQNVDRVLLERWWGPAEVGYYAAVGGVLALLQRVPLAAVILFFPQASEDAARGQLAEIQRRLRVVERYGLMITVPLTVMVVAVSDMLVELYLGEHFARSGPVLAALAFNPLLLAVFEPYNQIVYAVERHRRLVWVSLLGFSIFLVASALLIPRELFGFPLAGLGALGAALAGLIGQLVTGLCQVTVASRSAGVAVYWRGGTQLLAGAAMLATIELVRAGVAASAPGSIAALVCGLGAYVGILAALRELAYRDLRVLADLLSPSKMMGYVSTELRR